MPNPDVVLSALYRAIDEVNQTLASEAMRKVGSLDFEKNLLTKDDPCAMSAHLAVVAP